VAVGRVVPAVPAVPFTPCSSPTTRPGIPAADQEHVFTRFWRGDASRTRHTGGAGLGLAIVSSIVTAHGGTSEVISQVGQGTTIRVRLPARRVERDRVPS
jgi:signal transduction histidine kinase